MYFGLQARPHYLPEVTGDISNITNPLELFANGSGQRPHGGEQDAILARQPKRFAMLGRRFCT